MEREGNKDTPSPSTNTKEISLRKLPGVNCSGGGGDRLRRDEWSEGAVSSLLDAYESKWVLRNRAKLKGHDWEDVARHVSLRVDSTKSPKTQTQCKNKIESMKKRYRLELATAEASSWPLFPRLDLLLRCRAHPPTPYTHPPLMLLDQPQQSPPPPPPPPPPLPQPILTIGMQQDSQESNGIEWVVKENGEGTKLFEHKSDKTPIERDSSTRVSNHDNEKLKSKKKTMMKKRQRREAWEVAESIRWLAEAVVRSEEARMDTMRELERMRVEAEAKKGEMELKRTEIIANTQLQIARLLSGNGKGIDSSLRIG